MGEVVDRRELLIRLLNGQLRNVAFNDIRSLVEGLGFELRRVRGSHHVYRHPDIPARLVLQDEHGDAKPYQIRQLLSVVEDYDLKLEDE